MVLGGRNVQGYNKDIMLRNSGHFEAGKDLLTQQQNELQNKT